MSENNIWTANKYIKELVGDRESPRIPTLRKKDEDGVTREIHRSEDKARLLASLQVPSFPPPTQLLSPLQL